MKLGETGHGCDLIQGEFFRTMVVDVITDGHEFFDVFLLFGRLDIREFVRKRGIDSADGDHQFQQAGTDRSIQEQKQSGKRRLYGQDP